MHAYNQESVFRHRKDADELLKNTCFLPEISYEARPDGKGRGQMRVPKWIKSQSGMQFSAKADKKQCKQNNRQICQK